MRHFRLSDYLETEIPVLPLSHQREAVAIKCNVVNWDDQLSLFELAFEKYGAVDIVVCVVFILLSP